jgi:hypothetical protein
MAYSIFVSERAQEEIKNAIEFYAINSKFAPIEFIQSLSSA